MLGSDMDDFEFDDNSTIAGGHHGGNGEKRYCIEKEEYPPELLRTFDII